jgi:hypothetical protein
MVTGLLVGMHDSMLVGGKHLIHVLFSVEYVYRINSFRKLQTYLRF